MVTIEREVSSDVDRGSQRNVPGLIQIELNVLRGTTETEFSVRDHKPFRAKGTVTRELVQ